MKLSDLDFKIYKAIYERLDIDSRWRNLIAITSNTRFRLTDIETEKCAGSLYTGGSPSLSLLRKWDSIAMTVETLEFYLDKLKYEDCLKFIKQPVPLKISKHPIKEIKICGGKKLSITCEASGFPYPEYVWYRGSDRVGIDKQGTFVIRCAKPSDSGKYTCRVQHYVESTGWSYIFSDPCNVKIDPSNYPEDPYTISEMCPYGQQLISRELPRIVLQPTNKTSECGGPVVFKVSAQHTRDTLLYQWFHNNRPIPNASKSELRIEDVSKNDAGYYQVRVFSMINEKVQTMSKVAMLEVIPEPNQYTAGDKVALVIGNGSYRSFGQALPAVEYDLYHTTLTFEKMGFKVIALLDLTLEETRKAVNNFCLLVSKSAYVIFYCMGHGFIYGNEHYLIPWDQPQGNDTNESLCIETCMRQIQEKTPKLLMVLVDLCRLKIEHSQSGDVQKEKPSKSLPNYVIIYATILGEQSFEEGAPHVTNPRGLFNKYLLDVLDNPDVKVSEIYSQLQSKFQKRPYDKEKFSQHPQMDITLEEPQRSLWDPIHDRSHAPTTNGIIKEQNDAKTLQFAYGLMTPGDVHIPIDDRGLIVLSFKKYLSNVLHMKPEIKNFNPKCHKIRLELHKDRISQVIQPIKIIRGEPPEYLFCNLQKLKDKMTISLTINIISEEKKVSKLETELINLGKPLAASLHWWHSTT